MGEGKKLEIKDDDQVQPYVSTHRILNFGGLGGGGLVPCIPALEGGWGMPLFNAVCMYVYMCVTVLDLPTQLDTLETTKGGRSATTEGAEVHT